jgi:hypothetical protein
VETAHLDLVEDTTAWQSWGVSASASHFPSARTTPTRSVVMSVHTLCACRDSDMDGYDSCFECDDGNAAVYPGASEVNDGFDNQCPFDPGYGQTDEIEGLLDVSETQVCWPSQTGATGYEVLRSTTADFSSDCTLTPVAESCWNDATTPVPGVTAHYLVRSASPFVGEWGLDSSGDPRDPVCLP